MSDESQQSSSSIDRVEAPDKTVVPFRLLAAAGPAPADVDVPFEGPPCPSP